jgi:hypothetical protein
MEKTMKTTKKLALLAVLLVSGFTSHAITNSAIAVSGTNLILSWPSYGYESYLVQYRQTLDPADSWSVLTNAYRANSTNRTTFTIFDVVPLQGSNGGNYSGGGSGSPPFPSFASSSMMAMSTELLAVPVDGSGAAVPVEIFPPGFDFSNFNIFDPVSEESVSGIGYATPLLQQRASLTQDDLETLDSGGSSAPQTGFYRVFHIPNFLINFTNYTFSDAWFIPVDFAAPDADINYVEDATVLIGGQPANHAELMQYPINGVNYWGVGVYFDEFPNGTNSIQLLTTVRQSDFVNAQTPYIVYSNAPAAITIGNLITFTNWDDFIWDNGTYTFRAQTVPNVDWEIDIYDWNNNFVNYQTGHSSDGNISWTWNLYDYWGNPRNNPDSDPGFIPYFTITGNLSNSAQTGEAGANANSTTTKPGPGAMAQRSDVGKWIVTFQDKLYEDGRSNDWTWATQYLEDGINAIWFAPMQWQIPSAKWAIKFGRTYTAADRSNSWATVRAYLKDPSYRNFYYFGHGGTNGFGGDMNVVSNENIINSITLPGNAACVDTVFIKNNIGYARYEAHPYRFVFLDGCDTATGGLPDAFGIPKQNMGVSWYTSTNNVRHLKPSAFVGWDSEIEMSSAAIQNFWNYRKLWINEWSTATVDMSLGKALDDARDASGWWNATDITSHRKIYGNDGMVFRQ